MSVADEQSSCMCPVAVYNSLHGEPWLAVACRLSDRRVSDTPVEFRIN